MRNFVEKFKKIMVDAFDGRVTYEQNRKMTDFMRDIL